MARRTLIRLMGTALIVASALAGAGCGGNGASGAAATTTAASRSSSSSSSSVVNTASQRLSAYEKQASQWPAPTEAFHPGHHKAAILVCGTAGGECNAAGNYAKTAIKALGWTASPVFDGGFSPQKQAAAIDTAVGQGYDAIIIAATDVNSIKGAIDNALAKHVAIACVLCVSGSYRGKVLDTSVDFSREGEQIGWYILAHSDGKVHGLSFTDKAYPQVIERTAGTKKTIESNCPDCTWDDTLIPSTDLGQPGPPTFTAALATHPKGSVTDVAAPYDLESVPMAKTAAQSGRTEIKVSGYQGSAEMISTLAAPGDLNLGATVGEPWEYATWAAVDLVARKVAGKPMWDATKLPTLIIDKQNAAKFVGTYFAPTYDWKSKFKSLWSAQR